MGTWAGMHDRVKSLGAAVVLTALGWAGLLAALPVAAQSVAPRKADAADDARVSVVVRSLEVLGAATDPTSSVEGPERPPHPRAGSGRDPAAVADRLAASWTAPGLAERPAAGWVATSNIVIPDRGRGGALPPGTSSVPVPAGGSLYFRLRFDVADVARARSLELEVLYRDGFVAYLNGVEVARRNVPVPSRTGEGAREGSRDARPPVPHSAELEHVYLAMGGAGFPALRPRDNLLAVRVVPASTRGATDPGAPAGQIAVAVLSRVRLVRGPYLIDPADGAVSVAWETDLPARGRLLLEKVPEGGGGASAGRPIAALPAAKAQVRQVVRLSGLEAGQRYRYRVEITPPGSARGAPAVASAAAELEAAPASHRPARFVVYGDMRAPGHATHAQIVAAIVRERPALVLNSGDLVALGSEESGWQRYFQITAPLGAMSPVVPALGNHEAYLSGGAKSWALFGLRSASPISGTGYTSLDWGGIHFVVLDSNNVDSAQRDWLAQDLAAARRRHPRAIFAVCHDGPWSHGTHGGSEEMVRIIAPVLVAGGVDVLFSGHDHLYERGTGVVGGRPSLPYLVAGGGGAPLYNPTCVVLGGSTSKDPGRLDVDALTSTLPACPAYVAVIKKAYHYIVVEVDDDGIHLCPRAPDGAALEPCVSLPLAHHNG